MSVRERIIEFVSYKKMSNRAFSISIGRSINYVANIRQSIQPDVIEKIKEVYPEVNISWIMTGEGTMLKPSENEGTILEPEHEITVPLINKYAYAGYLSGYGDAEYCNSLPQRKFIIDHEAKGNYIAIEVRGDSMDDGSRASYIEGDILLCREIRPDLYRNSKLHFRDWDFVIVHEDGILIKHIIAHDVEHHTITIHSLNTYYEDRVLDLSQVKKIFSVVQMQRATKR